MANLTDKQKAFCEQYVLTGNATQAAITAGYSKNTASSTGYKLKHNTHIQDYCDQLIREQNKIYEITKTEIIGVLKKTMLNAIKDSDSNKAAEILARMGGFLNPVQNVVVTNKGMDFSELSDAELQQLKAKIEGGNV